MANRIIIEDIATSPESARGLASAKRNVRWFDEHVQELEVYKRYRGKYVAAANEELFVADDPEELRRIVAEKYPDELPHVRYIPREKAYRIYACQR